MIHKNFDEISKINYPVIIIGSGPAGIATALGLEKKKIESLIIEAGEEDYSEVSQNFYKGKVIGDPLTDISNSRLRQFGGTSGHWGGWCKPLEYYSFDNWVLKANDLENYRNQTCKIQT